MPHVGIESLRRKTMTLVTEFGLGQVEFTSASKASKMRC